MHSVLLYFVQHKVNGKNCKYTGCLKIIVFPVRGLVGDILLTK
jgi:hypothetical protein